MKKIILTIGFVSLFNCYAQSSEIKRQRIISIAPAITETLFGLGLDDEIIGVTTFCNYPPKALTKEKVGTFSQPNIEKILSLKPDIIFATGLEQASVVEKLKQLKLNVFVSDPSNLQEVFTSILKIGKMTSREKESEVLVRQMIIKIEQVKTKVKTIPQDKRPKVFVEIWNDPLMTAGKGSFVDELISLAGGINIANDTPRPYSYFSAEQVIKRNPDCIILGYMEKQNASNSVKNRLGWKEINAVRNNRIYNDINSDIIFRSGPRLAEGLEEIHKRLYPVQ